MNKRHYYKVRPRDFIADTAELRFEAKAAYRLILDLLYLQAGALSDDSRYISNVLGCSVRKWKSLRAELIQYGKIQADCGIISKSSQNYRRDKTPENERECSKNNGLAEIIGPESVGRIHECTECSENNGLQNALHTVFGSSQDYRHDKTLENECESNENSGLAEIIGTEFGSSSIKGLENECECSENNSLGEIIGPPRACAPSRARARLLKPNIKHKTKNSLPIGRDARDTRACPRERLDTCDNLSIDLFGGILDDAQIDTGSNADNTIADHGTAHPQIHTPAQTVEQRPIGVGAVRQQPIAKRKKQFPEDWQPTAAGNQYALECGCPDIAQNVAACIDTHRAKGSLFLDLDAAWRTWCRNARDKFGWHGDTATVHTGSSGSRYSNAGDRTRAWHARFDAAAAEICAERRAQREAAATDDWDGGVSVFNISAYR